MENKKYGRLTKGLVYPLIDKYCRSGDLLKNYAIIADTFGKGVLRPKVKLLRKQPPQATRCEFVNEVFGDIRIPMVCGWLETVTEPWQPIEYPLWAVVEHKGAFYPLMSLDGFDNNIDPFTSDCWGAIADYDPEYNGYELSEHEYVVYDRRVFYPETDVNADIPQVGRNLSPHDPRNYNLKKHMVRLALYELTKLIAPNNVSVVRLRDYEDSMKWLGDAAKLRLNPQIPRKLDETEKPVAGWQLATFQTNYAPYRNPWLV